MKNPATQLLMKTLGNSACNRCGGMMVEDFFFGREEVFNGRRCAQCGEIIDPVILLNRMRPAGRSKKQDNKRDLLNPPTMTDLVEAV